MGRMLSQELPGVKSLELQLKLFYLVSACESQGDQCGFLIKSSFCTSEKIAVVHLFDTGSP